jgi:hypothetical protein
MKRARFAWHALRALVACPVLVGTLIATAGVGDAVRFSNGIVVENWGLHDHTRALGQLRSEE